MVETTTKHAFAHCSQEKAVSQVDLAARATAKQKDAKVDKLGLIFLLGRPVPVLARRPLRFFCSCVVATAGVGGGVSGTMEGGGEGGLGYTTKLQVSNPAPPQQKVKGANLPCLQTRQRSAS